MMLISRPIKPDSLYNRKEYVSKMVLFPQSGYFGNPAFITLLSCSTISQFNNYLFELCQDYCLKCFSPRQLMLHTPHIYPDTNSTLQLFEQGCSCFDINAFPTLIFMINAAATPRYENAAFYYSTSEVK